MTEKETQQAKHDLQTHLLIFGVFSVGLFGVDFFLDRIIEWAWLPVFGWLIAIIAHVIYYFRTK